MLEFLRRILRMKPSSDALLREAIHSVADLLPAWVITDCLVYIDHNESELSLDLLTDRLVTDDIPVTQEQYAKIRDAMEALGNPPVSAANFRLIRVMDAYQP